MCVVIPRFVDHDICNTYKTYWESLRREEEIATDNYEWIRLPNSSELIIMDANVGYHLGDGSELKDFDFIHFVEAQFQQELDFYLDKARQHTTVAIEASGTQYGSQYHTLWNDGKPGYKRLFLPWFLGKDYVEKFYTAEQRWAYEDVMNEFLGSIGSPFEMPSTGYMVNLYEQHTEDWMKEWEGIMDFRDWTIDTENIKWYESMYDMWSISEMTRDYPTFSWEAFS